MTKMTFMSAALIAATAFATQAMAAGNDVAARHGTPRPTLIRVLRTVCGLQTSARLPRIPILYRLACLTPLLHRAKILIRGSDLFDRGIEPR
jgi:hypothetical protein